jgi:hypothetical protein
MRNLKKLTAALLLCCLAAAFSACNLFGDGGYKNRNGNTEISGVNDEIKEGGENGNTDGNNENNGNESGNNGVINGGGNGSNDGNIGGGNAAKYFYGFDLNVYIRESDAGGVEFLTVEIHNNSDADYKKLLVTLVFLDAFGNEIFEYATGVYVNFERGQSAAVYIRTEYIREYLGILSGVAVKKLSTAPF